MKKVSIILGCFVLAATAWQPARAAEPCAEKLAADLLKALLSRDEQALKRIANNPDVFDGQAIEYLIGKSATPFHGRADLKSAYSVLKGELVLKKLTVADSRDGSKTVEVVYLPTSTANDFVELAKMVTASRALTFRDYVMCSIVVRNGSAFMPHACYAETDALD